ncbi:hypothetical protein FNV43_RR09256 [Rhamnella rubrinervis]|uniref:Protein LURP-one-related 4 n=1 Tax=Rhamnella rubrinervis TaxID=2594499 RepID=A0A8K0HAZ8_9ROSA|nr:hypothetical protein FNV43_RR09256 [Rhamnella rubrinervis]
MANKVYPQSPSVSAYMNSERETFTIWMKSLVYQTNGCTVYNSQGQIVFRVDNYEDKCSNEVHLMDLQGNVLCTIRKKKLQAFGGWVGYRWNGSDIDKDKPWFQVKRSYSSLACEITVDQCDKYWIMRLTAAGKAGFKIVDGDRAIVAEAKQKQSSTGVALGNDVLSLEVEGDKDHSLIMALVTVYGLIRGKI